jgi:type IV pilus assembly protein PilC
MAKFFFKAKNETGEVREGIIESATADGALDVVQKNGLYPIIIREEGVNTPLLEKFLGYWDRVNSKELMMFFRQLSILIEAKVPITASLLAIKEQTSNIYFKKIIEEIINDIQDGLALSDALKKQRGVFSTMAINIVKAGEVSGNLRKSVSYVADNIEKNYNLTSKVKSAMMYPMVVLIVFFIIGFIVVSFIVPKLTLMIKSMDVDIPWYTSGLILFSDFMSVYWWAVAIVILGFIGGLIYYLRTEEGRLEWDQIKIKLPIFGEVFQHVYIARFADNLAVLLAGGIPIIKALEVVSSVIGNSVYEAIFLKAVDEVKIGGNMSDALRRFSQIPPIVSQMVRIGEESGQIDLVLNHVARFYEQETDEATKNLSVLIEPILMVIIGIAVGFLAFSIIMPIYDIAGKM